jgi:transcriptional regulator with XRE-family HTH domain
MKQKHQKRAGPARNPLYEKIGKRIRQARLMAKESNSRTLSERLGWSGGRINNFETGASTPGVEETLLLCETLGVDPCWVTYGVGSPRAASVQDTRRRNLMALLDEAEAAGELAPLVTALQLNPEQVAAHRANPFKRIGDALAARCEHHLGQPAGWLDEARIEQGFCTPLPEDMRRLLDLYARLSEADQHRLYAMGVVLLGSGGVGGVESAGGGA